VFILRLLLILSALGIILSGGMYLFTSNRRYLGLAWEIVRFTVFALLLFGALYLLERYVLIAWKVLL
jgi:hypothetical protein